MNIILNKVDITAALSAHITGKLKGVYEVTPVIDEDYTIEVSIDEPSTDKKLAKRSVPKPKTPVKKEPAVVKPDPVHSVPDANKAEDDAADAEAEAARIAAEMEGKEPAGDNKKAAPGKKRMFGGAE